MSDTPAKIGRYPIDGEIGRGGMGVVYRARDPLLQRPVALKLLRESRTADREWILRFELEARALAALNHPNIAVIHGLEETDAGRRFLVLEYVEGRSLGDRLLDGPLAPRDALLLCRQITLGLEAAHRRGIVHCDLKPDNVRITPDGLVKILDFGVARSLNAQETPPDSVDSTLATTPLGLSGKPGGTPGYMSPEQARGEAIDQRTDIWAFGCILYQCLSGKRPFRGESKADVLAATIITEPEWSALPTRTPPALESLMRRCLEKDPARRPAGMEEVRAAIDLFLEVDEGHGVGPHGRPTTPAAPESHPGGYIETNLPNRLTSFVGREWDIEDLRRMLRDHRLVTVVGGGGCGKTRLAVETADRMLAEFPGGVWMVELAPLVEASLVAPTVAGELGVPGDGGAPSAQAVAAHIGPRDVLLVLDNCEHLLGECAFLAETLLRRCPRLRVLATSREALAVGGEAVYPLEPLVVPDENADLETLQQNEAIRLFAERAAFAKPGFRLTRENAAAVAAVCRRLDGLPLAIELAAARVSVLPVEEIRTRLDDRFGLLARGTRTAAAHHRTLRETIAWSYRLLEPEEQRLFRRLSVFSGGWTLETGCAVHDADEYATLDLLSRLVEKSLVLAGKEAGQGRYRYLETVRQFAHEELVREGEEDAAEMRRFFAMAALAARSREAMRGAEATRWLDRLDHETENLRAALDWAGARPERAADALRVAVNLYPFWAARGVFAEGSARLTEALERGGAALTPRDRAEALNAAGALAAERRDQERAVAYYEESLALYLRIGDERGAAAVAANMGKVMFDQDQPALALELHNQSLAMFRSMNDAEGIGEALENVARTLATIGENAEAESLLHERLRLAESSGDTRGAVCAHRLLVATAVGRGDAATARKHLDAALMRVSELGLSPDLVLCLEAAARLSAVAPDAGSCARAAVLYGAGSALRLKLGFPPSIADARYHAAALEGAGSRLGETAFQDAWERGVAMSPEEALISARGRAE